MHFRKTSKPEDISLVPSSLPPHNPELQTQAEPGSEPGYPPVTITSQPAGCPHP